MGAIIIDVREPQEFATGHVRGALNIPPSKLLGDIPELEGVPKDAQIILYCRSGARSTVAMNILRGRGYTNLVNGINQGHVEARLT